MCIRDRIDTTLYTDYHRNLVAKGAVIKFTMKFIEGHRKELEMCIRDRVYTAPYSTTPQAGVETSPVASQGVIYIGASDGYLYAIDLSLIHI